MSSEGSSSEEENKFKRYLELRINKLYWGMKDRERREASSIFLL